MAKDELLFTLKTIITVLIFFTAKPVFANSYPEISNQDREWVMNLATKSLNSVMEGIKEKYLEYRRSIDTARKQDETEVYKLPDEKATLRVFVSSSMSEELLKSYVKAAGRYNAILVFKGLPKGSWQELSRIVALMNDNNDEIQIQLDDEEKQNLAILKAIAKKVELFLFFKSNCNHCEVLEKHLARFADIYGFKVEAVSIDGTISRYFKTHTNTELIERLQLKEMPTVIAVTNDSSLRFELARGAVSVADLEDNSLLMAKYLEVVVGQGNGIKGKE